MFGHEATHHPQSDGADHSDPQPYDAKAQVSHNWGRRDSGQNTADGRQKGRDDKDQVLAQLFTDGLAGKPTDGHGQPQHGGAQGPFCGVPPKGAFDVQGGPSLDRAFRHEGHQNDQTAYDNDSPVRPHP